ncbi:MAG: glycosyltransferase family 2 protein [Rhodomicrobium sp.]
MSQVDRPKYSILIPTRNGLRYLPYAIESVLSQSSDEFELIVSDNHSSDGTAEYLSQQFFLAPYEFRTGRPGRPW